MRMEEFFRMEKLICEGTVCGHLSFSISPFAFFQNSLHKRKVSEMIILKTVQTALVRIKFRVVTAVVGFVCLFVYYFQYSVLDL